MKRRRRVVLFVVLIWFLAVGALVGLAYLEADKGRESLRAAQKMTKSDGLRSTAIDNELSRAATHLGRAHDYLAFPLVQPFRLVPVAGRQLSSAIALADAGERTTSATHDALTRSRAVAEVNKSDRPALLRELATIADETHGRVKNVSLGPTEGLATPLAEARNEASTELNRLRNGLGRAAAAARGAEALFQREGTYLVVAGNPAEMRAGSGMFLSVGTMTTGNGTVTLGDMRSVTEVTAPSSSVKWPKELQDRWGWLGFQNDFRNLMASPRFDVAAPIAKQIWEKDGHPAVDGVMMIDPAMLRAVLASTGPVKVDDKSITSQNVLKELMFEQYKSMNGTDSAQAARREGLSKVATAAFGLLNEGRWDPVVLARELSRAADARHLLLWSEDAKANDDWRAAGVAGEVSSNSLLPAVINVGGNKLDQFLKVDATAAQVTGRTGVDFSVVVKLTNTSPIDLPQYTLGPLGKSKLVEGEYQGLLSMTVPADATGLRFDGEPKLAAFGLDGPTGVIATEVQLKRGETKTLTVRFSRPATARVTVIEPSARIPAVTWHYQGKTWSDDGPHTVTH